MLSFTSNMFCDESLLVSASILFLTLILGVYVSGYQGAPYTYVVPSVAPPAYNAMNYRPNGAGGKFPNSKVLLIPII